MLTLERLESRDLLTTVTSEDTIVNARTAGDFNHDGIDDILFGFEEGYLAVVWGNKHLSKMDEVVISRDGVKADGFGAGFVIDEWYRDDSISGNDLPRPGDPVFLRGVSDFENNITELIDEADRYFDGPDDPSNWWHYPSVDGIDFSGEYILQANAFAGGIGSKGNGPFLRYSNNLITDRPSLHIPPSFEEAVYYAADNVFEFQLAQYDAPGTDFNGDGIDDRLWKFGNEVDIEYGQIATARAARWI